VKQLRTLFFRLAAPFTRRSSEIDLDAEMQSHLDMHIEDNLRTGMSPQQARKEALMKLGGVEQTKEAYRERRGLPWLETFLKDFRYSCRALQKNPGFTTVAVLTLALGIAVNATMFSLVSAFLLRRPAGRDPERVAVVSSISATPTFLADAQRVSVPNYLVWSAANHVFTEMAATDPYRTVNMSSDHQPEAVNAAAVSLNYFRVLGVEPQFGRTFANGEDQPGRERVVILSHDLWVRRFGSDPSIITRTIRLNRSDYSVIGAMPETFQLMGFTNKLWIPLVLAAADQTPEARSHRSLRLFARLKPAATLEQARAEFASLARRAEQDFPETEKGWGASVRTLPDFLIHDFAIRGAMTVIMTTVGLVLLIACANVAGLLLARSAHRRKELAIRVALGAGRLRLVRQCLTEGLVISLLGGAFGLFLSLSGIEVLRANFNFNEAAGAVPISLDWNVVLFAAGISLLSTLLCGLAPALNASRTDVNSGLKQESRAASGSSSQSRLRKVFVTAEIALALFLLVGTGLLIRTLFLIHHQDLGFQPEHLLTADVALDALRYKNPSDCALFAQQALRQLRQIPSARAVAATSDLPATGAKSVAVQIKGQPDSPTSQKPSALDYVITPEYFQTAGIPSLRGRTFSELDTATSPRVSVVNQEFVRRFFPDQDPIGQQIGLDLTSSKPEWSEIVGIVGNVNTYSEDTRVEPQVYQPFPQRPLSSFSLMVLAGAEPGALASALRAAVAQIDPELPLARVLSMPAVIDLQKGGDAVFSRMLGTFALLALILAAIGIYGLITYSVNQRVQEIGIRMSLGADSAQVLRMILLDGLKISAVGAAAGLLLALPLPKMFAALFFDMHLHEPVIYFIVPAVILAVATLATYVPARRATRVDPIRALRLD
jgi:putative ABC transport system permease protein